MLGQIIAHYKITGVLGKGGMGVVYEAQDLTLDRKVALKFLTTDESYTPERLKRFEREARLASGLTHPNICTIYELGEDEGRPYIVMERLEGMTLQEKVKGRKPDPEEVRAIALQICTGLQAAHSRQIVHRDIKPSNIFVTDEGFVKILDFGLARLVKPEGGEGEASTNLTREGAFLGTVRFMSPEQALGKPVDHRSDLFSLGLVLFYLATGKPAFGEGSAIAILNAIINQPIPSLAQLRGEISPQLYEVLAKLLEKRPEDRYGSASEVISALREGDKGVGGKGALRSEFRRERKKKVSAVILAAAMLVVAIILTILYYPAPPSTLNRLAILPLSFEGPEEQARLANMLPALVYESLRADPDLFVASFDSSRTYGAGADYLQVAEELGVDWLLKGALKVEDDRYEVRLHLFGPRQMELWSRNWTGETGELLAKAGEMTAPMTEVLGEVAVNSVRAVSGSARAIQYYLEGKTYLEGWDIAQNFESARTAFGKAVEEDPNFGLARAGLALSLTRIWEAQRDPALMEQAIAEARKAVSLAVAYPEPHLSLGVVLLEQGRLSEAMSSFEKAQSLAPRDDSICRKIGDAYERLGEREKALEFYERAVELRPEFWENYLALGNYHLYGGEFEEAKRRYRELIRLRPESDVGHNNLAIAHLSLGEMDEAETHLHAALTIQPNYAGYNNLGFIDYSAGRYQDAAEHFEVATRLAQNEEAWINLGDSMRQLGRGEEAEGAYEEAIRLISTGLELNPDALELRAKLIYSLGGLGRCDVAMEQIRGLPPARALNPLVDYYLGIAAALCKEDAAATEYISQAIQGGLVADVRTNPDLARLLSSPELEGVLE